MMTFLSSLRRAAAPSVIGALMASSLAPAFAQEAPVQNGPQPREALETGLEDRRWYPASGRDLANLLEGCEASVCMSFVAGAMAGLSTRAYVMGEGHPFCAGDSVRPDEIRDAILAEVAANPDMAAAPAAYTIIAAFATRWPCPEDGSADGAADPETATADAPMEGLLALEPGATQALMATLDHTLELGAIDAGVMRTLVVFHDPNCIHCAAFKAETDALLAKGWALRVVPVGILGEDSHGYASLMAAFAATRPDAVEALYRDAVPGEATVARGLAILQTMGIGASEALGAVSSTSAYEAISMHNESLFRAGGKGTPAWILADHLATGGAPAATLESLSQTLPTPPGAVGLERPAAAQQANPDNGQDAPTDAPAETTPDAQNDGAGAP